ncbi:MAG TPA: tRNA (adenosine(37)-N6)-dimethylallyltransferase MiaA, partial [Tepidiformaceae bacterium]|nr:tRNA (adenosine(37)-N6)-dimethylallyltransferase MiaA [Tepidiformaceae bacterium]
MLRRLVAIVGATGTGKSAVALELAQRLGGEIVNADSRQVYRGMDIGTAKPSLADRRKVRHHLFDVAEPADGYGLTLYQQQAKAALESIWARNTFAWLVGGTGQYVWGLLEAWQAPDVAPDPALRAELEAFAAEHGHEALAGRLAAVDPLSTARIDHRNVRRVIRAIEVYEKSGRTMSEWQSKGTPDFEFLLFGVDVPRDVLYPRVDRRVDAMFESGLVAEVEGLLAAGVPADCPAMSSIGY